VIDQIPRLSTRSNAIPIAPFDRHRLNPGEVGKMLCHATLCSPHVATNASASFTSVPQMYLGVLFNIASYALWTMMVAQVADWEISVLRWEMLIL
jgi:hypothetical protein